MDKTALLEKLRKTGLSRVAEQIVNASIPSLMITTRPALTELSPHASKIGGKPALPPNIDWFTWNDETPLSFLAQFNLKELSAYPAAQKLPKDGLLLFFYDSETQPWGFDPEDRGSWKVLHLSSSEIPSNLRDYPPQLHDYGYFTECAVSFKEELSLPSPDSIPFKAIEFTKKELEIYDKFLRDIFDGEGCRNQLLGHPHILQNDMQLDCQLVSHGLYCGDASGYEDPKSKTLEAGASDWQLLFQLNSDENAQMMWGDLGCLYFWIKKQHLEHARFDKTWMMLQCY